MSPAISDERLHNAVSNAMTQTGRGPVPPPRAAIFFTRLEAQIQSKLAQAERLESMLIRLRGANAVPGERNHTASTLHRFLSDRPSPEGSGNKELHVVPNGLIGLMDDRLDQILAIDNRIERAIEELEALV